MSVLKRREIPLVLLFLSGILMMLDYFLKGTGVNTAAATWTTWAVILGATAMVAGTVLFIRFSITMVQRKVTAWPLYIYSIVLAVGTIAVGLMPPMAAHPAFDWVLFYLYTPIDTVLYAMLGFWITSASYRSLRARNVEAVILLVTAFLTIMMNMGLYPPAGQWILATFSTGANRAIVIGIAIGTVASGVKTLIGRERGMA